MTQLFGYLYDWYHYLYDETIDPRMKGKLLVGAPFQSVAIVGLYLYFCLKWGPRYMKDRPPFQINRIIQVYNAFEVLFCTYTLVVGVHGWYLEGYSFACQPCPRHSTPGALMITQASHFYYINKFIELLDTVFFILRKKYNQVTFLHVYHHVLMALMTSIGVNWVPGGHVVLMGLTNTFVHVVMYSYYFLSSLGPEWQKHLWWKKHLTLLQLVQFCIIFVHNFQVLFRNCDFPVSFNILMCLESGYFFYLFGKFYVRMYNKNNTEAMENGKKAAKSE